MLVHYVAYLEGLFFRIILVTLVVASLPRELEAVFGSSSFFASAALLCTP